MRPVLLLVINDAPLDHMMCRHLYLVSVYLFWKLQAFRLFE